MNRLALALLLLPTAGFADGITVANPMVPLAPPSAMVHAAYMTVTNGGDTKRHLIGVSSAAHGMAHLHLSKEENGVATMSAVDLIEMEPGQTVAFEQGGLHIMLMRPKAAIAEGDEVSLTLEFANGETVPVAAKAMKRMHGHAHAHGS